MKRETLVELAEYVNTPVGQKIFTESMMPDIIDMVRINLFRPLPPPSDEFDLDDEEANIEPSWPHLQIIYELFLRFIISPEVNGKIAKKFVDSSFLRSWIELFDAEGVSLEVEAVAETRADGIKAKLAANGAKKDEVTS